MLLEAVLCVQSQDWRNVILGLWFEGCKDVVAEGLDFLFSALGFGQQVSKELFVCDVLCHWRDVA